MIQPFSVAVSSSAATLLGTFTARQVVISNQGGHTVYLGSAANVTNGGSSNGCPIPSGSPPLNLGRVTGTLYAIADTATTTVGVVVSDGAYTT